MPTASPAGSAEGSRLSSLRFTDPQHEPGWRHVVVPAPSGRELPAAPRPLSVEVAGAGRMHSLEEWQAATSTTSLLVLEQDRIVHESYADGLGRDTLFLGASMTKSVLAHLVGRAVTDGVLHLDDPVTSHVPELGGSGYDGPTVQDVLTMTSGVDWVEDHRDPAGPASRLLAAFGDGGDSRALLRTIGPDVAPGRRWVYNTADSQVLDWVRERATGRSYADDAALLWHDLGCTHDAVVAVDGHGAALAGGGLAATSRDWARIALLAVDGTTHDGTRVLDVGWVDAAARAAYAFTATGRLPSSITTHAGFGLHWWPLDDDGARVTADGSRGQFAAADRSTGAVVVKTSLWPYDDALADRQARDLSYLGIHTLLDQLTPQ
ncbi:serine hydrolase domain-containing protein [Nocardioides hwasunensis]|uniref:Serine hydrolase n=1 Tax=Nocardioides hwasunensis TaxID=397258 RepID=A0ABR8MII5_9ACTN|nr:serine hydrolase [Nocardioides hwasunensis]MBD3915868.1 serine hydrolase [Nocardioides hwasunensis]